MKWRRMLPVIATMSLACNSLPEESRTEAASNSLPDESRTEAASCGATWSCSEWQEGPAMTTASHGHSATVLDDGSVLVTGGWSDTTSRTATDRVELFDPGSDQWTVLAPLNQPRAWHQAARLPDGRVLVVGGESGGTELATAEIFDPQTQQFESAAPMSRPRRAFSAQSVGDGVIVAGGIYTEGGDQQEVVQIERYDPATDSWQDLPSPPTDLARSEVTALPDGRLLLAGQERVPYDGPADSYSEDARTRLFVRADGDWQSVTHPCESLSSHGGATITTLASGKVLLTVHGGNHSASCTAIFDPSTDTFTDVLKDDAPRGIEGADTVVLHDGRVLLIYLWQFRVYDPTTASWTEETSLPPDTFSPPLVVLDDCRVMTVGGVNASYNESNETIARTGFCGPS